MMIDEQHALHVLRSIAKTAGVSVVAIGDPWEDTYTIIGSPPSGAAALCTAGRRRVLVCRRLSTAEDVEAALHELAHAKLGLDEEWACYELASVWALQFPVEVSTAVAFMAHETRS